MLTLTPGAAPDIRDPTAAQVAGALRAMAGRDDDFVILGRDVDGTFIQTAGGGDAGYGLEVCRGPGPGDLVRCTAELGIDEIEHAFAGFARGDPGWMAQYAWEVVEP